MRRVFVVVILRGLIMLADTEDLARLYTPASYTIKWTTLPWEASEAYKLRRAVFCIEQGIFIGDDRDEIDERAQLLVAVSCIGGMPEQVVGTVRIHEDEPGVWTGSRLAVHAAFRRHGKIGATLIRLAVSSAHALGCTTFLAHVQSQNAACFMRCTGPRSPKNSCMDGRII
jgi:putative N-acetyltransferase (TIGR04045 family)